MFKVSSAKTILFFYDTLLSKKNPGKILFSKSQIMARKETLTAQVLAVLSIVDPLLCLL